MSNGAKTCGYYITAIYHGNLRDTYDRAVRAMIRRARDDNIMLYPNLVIITTVNGAIYSKIDIEELEIWVRQKEDNYKPNRMLIKDLTISATTMERLEPDISSEEQVAFGSNINVEVIDNNKYIVTLAKVKSRCIKLAYVTWLCYIYNASKLSDKCYLLNEMSKMEDIKLFSELKHKYKIFYNKEDIKNVTVLDTLNQINLYYSKEHASLIIHKDHLDTVTNTYMRWLAKPRYLSVIKPIEDNSNKYLVHNIDTLDIECVREYNVDRDIITHTPCLITYNITNLGCSYIKGLDCIKKMFTLLEYLGEDLTLWMHNASGYDTHIILDHISHVIDISRTEPVEVLITDQSIISLTIYLRTCTITIKDSIRLLDEGLDKLCDTFKVETPKIKDIDASKFTYTSFDIPEVINYALVDVISLKQVLEMFSKRLLDMGYPNPLNFTTTTSLAKNIFYSMYYNKSNHKIYELNKPCYDFIKPGYNGGIVRAYKPGLHEAVYTWDVKSAYSYAGSKLLPCDKPKLGLLNMTITKEEELQSGLAFYHCYIIPPTNPSKYVTPIHIYRDDKLNYIDDENEGIKYKQCLFSETIRLGLQYGYSYRVIKYVGFRDSYPLLESYMRDLYALKLEAEEKHDLVMLKLVKLLLNALYGWFGYNMYDKEIVRIYSNNDTNIKRVKAIEEAGEGRYNVIDNYIYAVQTVDIDMPRTNIAIAAAITAYARIHLFNLAKEVQDMGYEIYYEDTDSIKCKMEHTPINHPMFGKQLGQLDREHKGKKCVECNIYSKKMLTTKYYDPVTYKYNTVITSKGIKVNKHYIDHINIENSDESYKEDLAEHMKQRYLEGKVLDIIHGQIYTGKSNRIRNMPGLYEKTMIKRVKLS